MRPRHREAMRSRDADARPGERRGGFVPAAGADTDRE